MSKEIDHQYTDEIICPYCGYEFSDSWDYGQNDDIGMLDCCECGKSFYATRNVLISYSTQKAKYGKCKICGKENTVLEDYHSTIGRLDYMCLDCQEKELRELRKKYFESLEK